MSKVEIETNTTIETTVKTISPVFQDGINEFCRGVRALNQHWWDSDSNIPTKLCLIHSEISEGLEGYRKSLKDDKLPERDMLEVELADAIIRIADLCGELKYDLGGAIADKLEYNQRRADHTSAVRSAPGGKRF